jgi:hypothetical protein
MTLAEAKANYDRMLYEPLTEEEFIKALADLRKRAGHGSETNFIARDVKSEGDLYP